MADLLDRYQHVVCRKSEGAHYTPTELSLFISKNIIEKIPSTKQSIVVTDPAIGDGELILSFLNTLRGIKDIHVIGFDINQHSIEIARKRILEFNPNIKITLIHADFIDYCLDSNDLFIEYNLPKSDVVITNPPYIRTQLLGSEKSQYLAKNFKLNGRVDSYQVFLLAISSLLSTDGIAGVIVSNRFLSIKGASALRSALYDLYNIYNIWDFGDTKLFEAAVLPAVLLFSLKQRDKKCKTEFISIYETKEKALYYSDTPIAAISQEGVIGCSDGKSYIVTKGHLDFDDLPGQPWRINNQISNDWLMHVQKHTWKTFGQIGKIRVGVKTTADKVFLRESQYDDEGNRIELTKKIVTHHVAQRFKQSDTNMKYILYTHESINGKRQVIDINKYPVSKKYLEKHRAQLERRKYIRDSKRNWYEIWVPQDPSLWKKDKVIFRDICEEPTFWIDQEQSIVNGDCYWMVNDYQKDNDDYLWLILAVANSKFIEKYYDMKFNNKLYSNKRRFISQYVEKFPLPDPSSETANKMILLAKKIYKLEEDISKQMLEKELDQLVWEAFKLPKEMRV